MTNAGVGVAPSTTLAIILGASAWPDFPLLQPSEAFTNSARGFCNYLLVDFGVPQANVLDLFDSADSPPQIDLAISTFLKRRLASEGRPTDLVIYYVGHGAFNKGDYLLALRSTRHDNVGVSALRIRDVAQTLRDKALPLRRWLILDCCFAAAAYEEFQSAPLEVAAARVLDAFPLKGTALLCASGPRDPAMVPTGKAYTMFSGELLEELKTGEAAAGPAFTLSELGDYVTTRIRQKYDNDAVRPQVLSPDQPDGDIARTVPLFPNAALRQRAAEDRLATLEEGMRQLAATVEGALRAVQKLSSNASEHQRSTGGGKEGVIVEEKNVRAEPPGWILAEVVAWRASRLIGKICLALTVVMLLAAIAARLNPYFDAVRLIALPNAVFLSVVLAAMGREMLSRRPASGSIVISEEAAWASLSDVVSMRATRRFVILGGLSMASPYFEASSLVSTVTFLATVSWLPDLLMGRF